MFILGAADGAPLRAPSAPPSTGLKLWLKAGTGISLSGSKVTAWADQSGSGNNVSQATGVNQPTFNASSINGLPAVTGDPNTVLDNTSVNLLTPGSARHIIVVNKPTSGAGAFVWGGCLLAFTLSTPGFFCYLGENSGLFFGYGDGLGPSALFPTDPGVNNVSNVYEESFDGNSLHGVAISLNAVSKTLTESTTTVESGTTGFNVMGQVPGQGFGFTGDVAEILAYDHVLSGGDLNTARRYLQAKYAISLGV